MLSIVVNAQGTWTQKANFGGTRDMAVGFSIGTKGYIGTGRDASSSYLQDFWEWDQATNIWTQKSNFGGTARNGAVGFSIGTKGYIGIGYDGANQQDFWEWDQATNTWSSKATFGGTARFAAVGFSISNKGYIGTGDDGNPDVTHDLWEYTPVGAGVNEINLDSYFSVYPNPSNGKFTLSSDPSTSLRVTSIEVYNMQGEKIYSANQQLNNSIIDLRQAPSGVYF